MKNPLSAKRRLFNKKKNPRQKKINSFLLLFKGTTQFFYPYTYRFLKIIPKPHSYPKVRQQQMEKKKGIERKTLHIVQYDDEPHNIIKQFFATTENAMNEKSKG